LKESRVPRERKATSETRGPKESKVRRVKEERWGHPERKESPALPECPVSENLVKRDRPVTRVLSAKPDPSVNEDLPEKRARKDPRASEVREETQARRVRSAIQVNQVSPVLPVERARKDRTVK